MIDVELMERLERNAHAHEKITKYCRDLMLQKNREYGDTWRNCRITTLFDRLYEKVDRMKTLEKLESEGKPISSEGIDEELRDLINYSIFLLIRRGFIEKMEAKQNECLSSGDLHHLVPRRAAIAERCIEEETIKCVGFDPEEQHEKLNDIRETQEMKPVMLDRRFELIGDEFVAYDSDGTLVRWVVEDYSDERDDYWVCIDTAWQQTGNQRRTTFLGDFIRDRLKDYESWVVRDKEIDEYLASLIPDMTGRVFLAHRGEQLKVLHASTSYPGKWACERVSNQTACLYDGEYIRRQLIKADSAEYERIKRLFGVSEL